MSEVRKGIVIGVVVTLLGGVAMIFLTRALEPSPKLAWFNVADVTLEQETARKFLGLEKSGEFDLGKFLFESKISVLAVENSGNSPARDVQLIFERAPVGVTTNSNSPVVDDILPDGKFRYTIDTIEPDTQISIHVFGASLEPVIFHGGLTVDRRIGSWLERTSNEWRVAVIPLILIFLTAFPILALIGGAVSDQMKSKRDEEI